MYDALYSVVQGVVQHHTTPYDTVRHGTTRVRHGTTRYDTIRHTQTCTYVDKHTHVNGKKTYWLERVKMGPNGILFWSKQAKRVKLTYWHFASTTCRQCLQLADRVYLWCTVSTDPRPPSSYVRVNDVSGPSLGSLGILALRVYNMPTVSTISRPCLLVVHSVYRPQTAIPLCASKRC